MRPTGPVEGDEGPTVGPVCDALADADRRLIVERLDGPATASEIATACGVPLSTTYRKFEALSEAGLVAEATRIDDGQHVTTYCCAFDAVRIERLDDGLAVEIDPIEHGPDERLAELWEEVRSET